MRLPTIHPLLFAYIDMLQIRRRLFFYVDVDPGAADLQEYEVLHESEGSLTVHENKDGHQPPPSAIETYEDGKEYVGRVVYESRDGAGWFSTGEPTVLNPEKRNQTWYYMNGKKVRKTEYAADPEPINDGFSNLYVEGVSAPVDAWRKVRTGTLLDMAYDAIRRYIRGQDLAFEPESKTDVQRLVDGWAKILYDFDDYTLRRFLREEVGLPSDQIDAIGSLENLTSRLKLSFLHSFLGRADINPNVQFWELDGGSWVLPYTLANERAMWPQIQMNRKMTDIWMIDDGRMPDFRAAQVSEPSDAIKHQLAGSRVIIRTVTEADPANGHDTQDVHWHGGDVAIITIPFSALRFVRSYPQWSYGKRRAIQELHYDAATKVLLEFEERWWEFDPAQWQQAIERKAAQIKAMPSGTAEAQRLKDRQERLLAEARREMDEIEVDHYVGGGNFSDNPNRFMYFPSHKLGGSQGGVVLASYSWADDARRWDSVSTEDKYKFALRGLMDLHGQRIALFWTGKGAFQSWMQSPYAYGEAAVFSAGQFTELHPHIPTIEHGTVHFAGEHTSLKHAWIEGAIESGIRVAKEVHEGSKSCFWQKDETSKH